VRQALFEAGLQRLLIAAAGGRLVEAHRRRVKPARITIRSFFESGLRYGEQTAWQIDARGGSPGGHPTSQR
jgi:hypothetical protein